VEDGRNDSVHLDAVLDYNADPDYMKTVLLHRLTVEALKRMESSGLSRREIMRRLGTSASQLYRLLDPTNTTKSLGQLVDLLQILGCEVDVIVKDRVRRTA
jgi:predicted XRE-type DNA-binding protein